MTGATALSPTSSPPSRCVRHTYDCCIMVLIQQHIATGHICCLGSSRQSGVAIPVG